MWQLSPGRYHDGVRRQRAGELREKAERKALHSRVSGAWAAPSRRPLPLDRLRSRHAQAGRRRHLGEIQGETDALIRLRLKEQGLELPHLVVGATSDNQIVVRSNGDCEVMRSFGEDLKNVADDIAAPPEPGDTTP